MAVSSLSVNGHVFLYNKSMITIREYYSFKKGPTILFLGAIHGNEACGPIAMRELMKEFESKKITLLKGRVIFVPISNPLAYGSKQRFVNKDLNRIFMKTLWPRTYEQRIANILCEIVDRSDVVVDLHSTQANGPPSLFIDFLTDNNKLLAQSTGITLAVTGWPELYQKNRFLKSYDTSLYAHHNNKDCLLIECGQHRDLKAPLVAKKAIMSILKYYKMITAFGRPVSVNKALKLIRMSELYIKENEKDVFIKTFRHLQPLTKGQVIAQRSSGELIKAKDNMIMILPKNHALPGREWFYLGI